MKIYYRKTAPKVRDGAVQFKNNWTRTGNVYNSCFREPRFEKERPGSGYRHLVRKQDLYRFIELLPDWDEIAVGLDGVVLARGEDNTMGWHMRGVVGICAWERGLAWENASPVFVEEHRQLLVELGVPCEKRGPRWRLGFDERTARAFQLIDVFLHELGHHHDRMTTRSRSGSARGESFAEAYARRHQDTILEHYREAFDLV